MEKPTKRKSAKAPVEAENISSSIIQLVHDAIIVIDEDQSIFLFNQGAEQTFGYKASEVIGQRLDMLLPPQISNLHRAHVRGFAKAPEIARLMSERKEISGRRKNGTIFPIEASISKISSAGKIFFTAILRDITERKQAEEALRLSEEKYRQVLNNVDEVIYQVNFPEGSSFVNGRVEFVSERTQKILGYRPAEFIADPSLWFNLIHPDDRATVQAQTTSIMKTGKPGLRSYRIKDTNGEYHWLEDRVSPEKDKTGRVVRTFGVARDVTERKQAEETIESLARFPSENPNPLLRIQRDGALLYANEACHRLLQNWRLDIGKLVPSNLQEVVSETLAGQIGKIIETEHGQRVISFFVAPVVEKGYANLYGRDITESKQAEQQMTQLSMAVEQTADCVVITDREGVILYVNAAFEKETGYTREEALGKTPRILKSTEHDARFFEVLWKTILAGKVFKAVFINRKKTGELVYEQKTITPLKDSKGNITHFVSTAKNITEQAQAEKARRESEKQYRDLFESTSDLIQAVAPDGRLLFANRAWREALGYTEQELIDLNIDRVVHPEALTQCFETLQRAMSGGQVDRIETRFVTKAGKSIIVEGSVACRFEASQPMAITCFLSDITERKRTEQEIQLLLALTKAAAEAENFDSALTLALSLVCKDTGWDFGEVWIPSHDGTHLELGSPYYGMESFHSVSKAFEFAPGIGLPGQVWASGKPAWIPDVTVDTNFLRAAFAKEAGFKAAVGIPILADDIVVAVINFFLREARQEDERMIALVSAVASQLGTAFQRRRGEEALRKKEEHHRAVIESIFKFVPEGVLVLTESLNLLEQNKAFDDIVQKYAPLLGYSEGKLADEIIEQLRSKILSGDTTEIHIPKKSQ